MFHFHVHDIDPTTWKEHHRIRGLSKLFQLLRRIRYQGMLIWRSADGTEMKRLLADNKRQLEALVSKHRSGA